MTGNLPDELTNAIQKIYEPAGLMVTQVPTREAESSEYAACRLRLNNRTVAFRVAKTTPTKIGQFVTLWKRFAGKTAPLDTNDNIAFVIVHVSNGTNHGQFIFDQQTLLTKGIISSADRVGKMAFRLYPPWTTPTAKDAIKSQQWQLNYFFPITENGTADLTTVQRLFA
jgi:hypothetical protein